MGGGGIWVARLTVYCNYPKKYTHTHTHTHIYIYIWNIFFFVMFFLIGLTYKRKVKEKFKNGEEKREEEDHL